MKKFILCPMTGTGGVGTEVTKGLMYSAWSKLCHKCTAYLMQIIITTATNTYLK